jgi:phosphoribosylformimino-5-aminoimidazole carboxamide ribotide isomerase
VIVIPAIDVHEGACVRLRQGDYARATRYAGDPVDVARDFIAAGARRLHVVDLDAARGRPDAATEAAVRAVVRAASVEGCAVDVGGGVRTMANAGRWLAEGAAYVALGSVAVREPALAHDICAAYEGRVLLALDVQDGAARVEGWTETGGGADDVLASWRGWPSAGIVFTSTTHDGMLAGPDLAGLARCRALSDGDVFVSGGIAGVDDVAACATAGAAGVIIGRALYEGAVDLGALLERFTAPVR